MTPTERDALKEWQSIATARQSERNAMEGRAIMAELERDALARQVKAVASFQLGEPLERRVAYNYASSCWDAAMQSPDGEWVVVESADSIPALGQLLLDGNHVTID